jgi:hypothetical protein
MSQRLEYDGLIISKPDSEPQILWWSKNFDPETWPEMKGGVGLFRFSLRHPVWAWRMRSHLLNLARRGQLNWF